MGLQIYKYLCNSFVGYFALVIENYYDQFDLLDHKNNYRDKHTKTPSQKIKALKTVEAWANK